MIDIKVPIGRSGEWCVEEFEVSEMEAKMHNLNCHGRPILPRKYKRLKRGQTVVMSNTPMEIYDIEEFISEAKGKILIAGLGLGVLVEGLLSKKEIIKLVAIEKSQDVINLVAPIFKNDSRVEIINADIFKYDVNGQHYDYGWFDIWDNICGDNWEEMKILKRKFARSIKVKYFWCEYETKRASKF